MKTFNLSYGEVTAEHSANLSNGDTFTALRIENMFFHKKLQTRPSTIQIAEININEGDTANESYISLVRNWHLQPVVSALGHVTLHVTDNLTRKPIPASFMSAAFVPFTIDLGPMTGTRISYLEIDKSRFTPATNTVVGKSAILIFGLDTVYYIDDDRARKTFQILTNKIDPTPPAPPTTPLPHPPAADLETRTLLNIQDGVIFQTRLFLIGVGANLKGGTITADEPPSILFSTLNKIDDFVFLPSGYEDYANSAGNHELFLDLGEKLLGISTQVLRIVITTTHGVLNYSSMNEDDRLISWSTAVKIKIGNVPCYPSRAIEYEAFLLYPSYSGIRQQVLNALITETYGLYDQRSATFNNYLPTSLYEDNGKGVILAIEDGMVKSYHWASEPGGLLGTTTYYNSDYRKCVALARTKAMIYETLTLKHPTQNRLLIVQETDESCARDCIRLWKPEAQLVSTAGGYSLINLRELKGITGMLGVWVELGPNVWVYFIRARDDQNVFVAPSGTTPTTNFYYSIYPHTLNLSNQLPDEITSQNTTTESVRIDTFGPMGHINTDIYGIFALNDSGVDVNGTIIVEWSFNAKLPNISWFSGASYPSAPVSQNAFVLFVNEEMGQNYDVLKEEIGITPLASEAGKYYSYKFTSNVNIGNNITELKFKPKSLTKDAAVLQFIPVAT